MSIVQRLVAASYRRPRTVLALALLITALFALGVPRLRVDTDPENMLEQGQPDRLLYDRTKRAFGLHDVIVVGIEDPRGIYRPEALQRIARIVARIRGIEGVLSEDLVSLSTTNNAVSVNGTIEIGPVMGRVPRTPDEIANLKRTIRENRFLNEKVVSADGQAAAVYVPIRAKAESRRIAREIRTVLAQELLPGQTAHVAGLPVAEDTFGHEMFLQMALVAPLAFLGILALVYVLFRDLSLLPPVALTAALSVLWTMGALVATGQTIHIMSSMIAVFLMPIAILDDVHILSDVHERFRTTGDRERSLKEAMAALYRPMLFTSLTTAAGFASLALSPIPPVRVFGLYVAFGIVVAWLLTHTLVPAMFALMPQPARVTVHGPEPAGARPVGHSGPVARTPLLTRLVGALGNLSYRRAGRVLAIGAGLLVVGGIGVTRIRVDDNPVYWFRAGHPVRISDDALNRRFGGTYMAYLLMQGDAPGVLIRPEALRYLDKLQRRLEAEPDVGKTSSVADIVKRLQMVFHGGDRRFDRVPDEPESIGQILFVFQGSAQPGELDHFVTRDAREANIWVQMRTGESRKMRSIEKSLAGWVRANPPPPGIRLAWSGLNHINMVWQELMVRGMLLAVLGSFLVVLLLMALEFQSWKLGLLAMAPLTVAIVLSYGAVGFLGKSYDMPIAVCSALSLGLAIDFAIHFFERFRSHWARTRDVEETTRYMSGPPGRAIARNAIVISLGFLPLAISSLTPYLTVSLFFASLMLTSAVATLVLLPATVRWAGPSILEGRSR